MSRITLCRSLSAGLGLLSIDLSFSMPVFAEVMTASNSEQGLEEIVVTAERRSESLSKTPVAVAVLSAEALAQAQISTEQDLRSELPGLAIRAGSNTN